MRRITVISAVVLASLAIPALCEVGELRPVAVPPTMDRFSPDLMAFDRKFTKPKEGSGTVNPKAIVGTLKSGDMTVKVALDSMQPNSKTLDVIRFDFSGKGTFDNTPIVPVKGRGGRYSFGPKTIMVPVGDKKIPVQVQGQYQHHQNGRYLHLLLGTALEGQCKFGDKVYPVRIVDATKNLNCLDPVTLETRGRGMPQADRVFVGSTTRSSFGRQKEWSLYGQPVQVDGKWYELKVSDDLKISAEPVEVEVAKVQIPHENWKLTLLGEQFTLNLSGGKKPFEIPVDTYKVIQYKQQGVGDNRKAMLQCYLSGKEKVLTIEPGEVNTLAVGPPLTAKLDARVQGSSTVRFSLNMTEASGAKVSSITNSKGSKPAPPRLEVFDASGKKVHSSKMEYG